MYGTCNMCGKKYGTDGTTDFEPCEHVKNFIRFNKKSNKYKCIEMWEWLADNPGKSKYMWALEFPMEAKAVKGYSICFACFDVGYNCEKCPVKWTDGEQDDPESPPCMQENSPYQAWSKNPSTENALEVIYKVEDTWED